MKKSKKIFIALALAIALGGATASAHTYLTFSNISIPNLQGVYLSGARTKEIENPQSVETMRQSRTVQFATYDENRKQSSWINSSVNAIVSWSDATSNGNNREGNYNLKIRAANSVLSTTNFTGTWYIDNRMLG